MTQNAESTELSNPQPATLQVGIRAHLFNAKMRDARVSLGLSQKALGEKVGCKQSSIFDIESMRRRPSEKTLLAVSVALSLPPDDIWPNWLEAFKTSTIETRSDLDPEQVAILNERTRARLDRNPVREVINAETSQAALSEAISKQLLTLSYRERQIVEMRYGLKDGRTYTLEEVGHVFKVTRERVRSIEAKAIRKLQMPSRASSLVEFCEDSQ